MHTDSEWKNDFDKKFPKLALILRTSIKTLSDSSRWVYAIGAEKNVKDFIEALLKREKENTAKKLEAMKTNLLTVAYPSERQKYRNKVIDEILSALGE